MEKRYGSQSKRAQAIGDLDFRASQSEISLACLDFLTIRLLVLASRAKRTSGRKPPQAIDPPNKEEVYFVLSGLGIVSVEAFKSNICSEDRVEFSRNAFPLAIPLNK